MAYCRRAVKYAKIQKGKYSPHVRIAYQQGVTFFAKADSFLFLYKYRGIL